MKYVNYLVLAFVLGGCLAPAVAIPLFTTATIAGAGAAVGAGVITLGYDHVPSIGGAPTATPTPVAVTK